jgi:hypothetical protein
MAFESLGKVQGMTDPGAAWGTGDEAPAAALGGWLLTFLWLGPQNGRPPGSAVIIELALSQWVVRGIWARTAKLF